MNDTSAKVDSTHRNLNFDHLKESDKDIELDAQELRTITRQVAASVIADFADSSNHKGKSDTASGGGTSGCGSQSLAPPTSRTGFTIDLSGSDEWMVLANY